VTDLLLDTHVFLWAITLDPRLPAPFRLAIQDPTNRVHLSVVSIWEAVIKAHLGKLPLPGPPDQYLLHHRAALGLIRLPVDEWAIPHLAGLPPVHRDPFDRMLVAQALQHGLTLLTGYASLRAYPVPTLPAS
jgi:PIN domain nuclease of toxin-antitoxin system